MSWKSARFFVVMGVAGSGKTTIGEALAARLGCSFFDADDFHSPENVAKMASGQPLNDQDRGPWLERLAGLIKEQLDRDETAVLASSALKERYRAILRIDDRVQFIYLEGEFDLIWGRMQARQDHYMKPEMLLSQLDALEPPNEEEAIKISIDCSVDEIVAAALRAIQDRAD